MTAGVVPGVAPKPNSIANTFWHPIDGSSQPPQDTESQTTMFVTSRTTVAAACSEKPRVTIS